MQKLANLAQQYKLHKEYEQKTKGKCERHKSLIANQILKRSEVISVDVDMMES